MIKILNNTLNLDIQNFNNFNKNDLKRSDWFQLILLSLIDNNNLFELKSTKKGLNKSKEIIGNLYSKEFLEKIKHLISLYLVQIPENKNFSEAFNNKDLNSEKVSFLKNNIAQILNTNIEDFKIDKGKLSFIEEIISYLIKLNSEEITPSQSNQILEKVTFNFDHIHMENLLERLNNIMNLLEFQESFENKEKFLVGDDRKWLEFIRFLNEIKSLIKIQADINMPNQSLNHKSQSLVDKETFQNNVDISQMDNTQKLNENLSLRFKRFENKDFNISNQILEKVTFNFDHIHMENLLERLNNIMNLLEFQESFENKEKFLIGDDRKWLEFIRFLNEIKSLIKIQADVNIPNQSLNHKNQNLVDKETFQNNVDISQMDNTQKLNENLSLRFKRFENKDFNINNLVDSYSEEKCSNSNNLTDQFNKENSIFKNNINENIENNNLVFKKRGVLNKELSLYDFLNKRFEIKVNIFQNLVHNELIKNHLEIGNITKLENTPVVNFQKISGDISEIVKDMVLEIQPHGEKKALIKIEPPEMGFLDLEIKVKNKEVEIVAKIEKIELLQEIKQNLHNIKTSLEESGLNLKDVQLFLNSGFDNGNMVKNFEREDRNYSEHKTKTERIEEINSKDIKTEDLNKFYNRNGKYYYIV